MFFFVYALNFTFCEVSFYFTPLSTPIKKVHAEIFDLFFGLVSQKLPNLRFLIEWRERMCEAPLLQPSLPNFFTQALHALGKVISLGNDSF